MQSVKQPFWNARSRPANCEARLACVVKSRGEVEHDEPIDGSRQHRVVQWLGRHSQPSAQFVPIDRQSNGWVGSAVGIGDDAGQIAREPCGCRSENAEPEPLEICASGEVARWGDDGMSPRRDGEQPRWRQRIDGWSIRGASSCGLVFGSHGRHVFGCARLTAMSESISMMASWLSNAERVVVVTGAGISTDSGIPDYRGPQGVWTKNPKAEKMSDISYYISDPEVRQLAWQSRVNSPAWTALPNEGHRAIVRMHEVGKLHALVTQNIDGLHQQSGVPHDKVIEVHGTIRQSVCWECGDKRDMLSVLERVRAGEIDPPCVLCGGILKSDTISFGQALIPEVIDAALQASEQADVLLAIGSTLSVSPANQVVPRARAAGARVGIINGQPTAMDHYAHAIHVGDIASSLRQLLSDAGLTDG